MAAWRRRAKAGDAAEAGHAACALGQGPGPGVAVGEPIMLGSMHLERGKPQRLGCCQDQICFYPRVTIWFGIPIASHSPHPICISHLHSILLGTDFIQSIPYIASLCSQYSHRASSSTIEFTERLFRSDPAPSRSIQVQSYHDSIPSRLCLHTPLYPVIHVP